VQVALQAVQAALQVDRVAVQVDRVVVQVVPARRPRPASTTAR
jgi:hypothetical protein